MLGAHVDAFEEFLIQDTLKGRLEWRYMDEFTDDFFKNYRSNKTPAPFVGLIEDEFFRIDYHRAYACMSNAGVIYLYYALVSPGSEDPPFSTLYLSLHPMPYNPNTFFELDHGTDALYRLESLIKDKVPETLRYWDADIDHFVTLFLDSRAPLYLDNPEESD